MYYNVLPWRLKQTLPPIIWIFTEDDEMESSLPFKICSSLNMIGWHLSSLQRLDFASPARSGIQSSIIVPRWAIR